MKFRLLHKSFWTYGVTRLAGKAALGLFLLAAPALAEAPRVLAFGDSLTQGYGLVADQGFVPQLQDWLNENGTEATVVNGGVSGETTAGGAARADWSLTPDIDAMILTLGGNDMLRGLDPSEARKNLAAILDAASAKDVPVLLVGMTAPGNFGPDYKQAFDAMYPELSEEYGTLFFEDFFAGLGEGDPASLQRYFQADGIHPNPTGVRLIVEALGPKVQELVAAAQD